jgi:UDPglucose 6-dehydrogenase
MRTDGHTSRNICIVGTGYVGMASAIGFATLGHRVRGYDILPERIRSLQQGVTPYREDGIEASLRVHLRSGAISFHEDLAEALADADFVIVCVNTPPREDGSANLSYVDAAVSAIAERLTRDSVIVLRSTVPAGTTEALAQRTGASFLYAPEFLREASAVADFLNPDRIVVGADSRETGLRYAALFTGVNCPVHVTSYRDAELVKGFSNAFLALKISFANEVANMCCTLDADATAVLRGVGADSRIGSAFLNPGIGFGGPCFEKDVLSLDHIARERGIGGELLAATLRVNAFQPKRIVNMLEEELGSLQGLHIGIWGLAFKAGTDDVRDSLSLRIIEDLHGRGATMTAYDPAVTTLEGGAPCAMAPNALAAIDEADALLILTEWPEFASVPARSIASRLRRRTIVDGRNLLDPDTMAQAGMRYRGVGRRSSLPIGLEAVGTL